MCFRNLLVLLALLASSAVARAAPVDISTCGVQPPANLVVFVGKRVSIQEVLTTSEPYPFNQEFLAKYRVVRLLCGDYAGEEIEFTAFDHHGVPAFAEFETVLLYVSRHDGKLVQQKYQFQPVYETAAGGWAGCGDPYAREPALHRGSIKAVPIKFKRPVLVPIGKLSAKQVAENFPAEFFRRRGDKAECVAGADVADLFEVKRAGVLKSREIFK